MTRSCAASVWSGHEPIGFGSDRFLRPVCDRTFKSLVDSGPGEAEQAVVATVLEEARAELLGELDGLVGDRDVPHRHGLGVDVARGRRAVAVADVPGAALAFLAIDDLVGS